MSVVASEPRERMRVGKGKVITKKGENASDAWKLRITSYVFKVMEGKS
jgi:hypothetical protein